MTADVRQQLTEALDGPRRRVLEGVRMAQRMPWEHDVVVGAAAHLGTSVWALRDELAALGTPEVDHG